jgi:hypothetical protein
VKLEKSGPAGDAISGSYSASLGVVGEDETVELSESIDALRSGGGVLFERRLIRSK